jgi:outer membrane protein TolC
MLERVLALAMASVPVETLPFPQAIERALSSHPALRVAEQDNARAVALVEQARAPSLPSLGATLTGTRLDDERRLGDRVAAGRDQLSGAVTLSVPLLNTPRWAQWRRALDGAEVTRTSAQDVRRQVGLGAARAWLAVLAQQRALGAATRARDTARAHLEFAQGRGRGGLGNRLEEIRAAQELAVSEVQRANSAGQLSKAQEVLGVWVAVDGPVDVTLEEPPLAAPLDQAEALTGVEARRADVVSSKRRLEVAQASLRLSWMDYLPLLSAVFQPFTQNPPSLVQPLYGWQAQAVLSIPLYEGGLRYGQAHERAAAAKSAEAQLESVLRQAKSETRAAFELVQRADEALVAARDAARHAAEALELATLAWKAGASTNLEVTDAERRARDAETQAAVAEDAARQARLDVLAASGRFP